MESLHSISLVVLEGLCSFDGLLSFLSLVLGFFYVNLNFLLLFKEFFTVNALIIKSY